MPLDQIYYGVVPLEYVIWMMEGNHQRKKYSDGDRISIGTCLYQRKKSSTSTTNRLFKAYKMLDVPKQMFEGPTRYVQLHATHQCEQDEISEIVGMQLSMMYDLLYTKAAVVNTWYGWCVRVISQLSTAAALLLFHASTANLLQGGCSGVDVTATYVLLGGAVILDLISMARAVFSTWTCVLLIERGWRRLAGVL
jgi:hypothetical protein